MRKTIATALTVALAAAGVLSAPAVSAEEPQSLAPVVEPAVPPAAEVAPPTPPAPAPLEALSTARRVLRGDAGTGDPSATLALRDLWLTRNTLKGRERRQADAMLARPTDGPYDPVGYGYDSPSTKTCNARLCVHYVPHDGIGPVNDAPPSLAWVNHNLAVMDSVWSAEVGGLGFRPPVSDRGADGTSQFDVYLKDLGGSVYGYCSAERKGPRGRTASGYCVLDNNFSTSKFNGTPEGNLSVTAAHEFFHAVQYAYDYLEDLWMMESTATWVEERVASAVNDNRQYLSQSQLYAPQLPLDLFVQGRSYQYGNWIFWEYLSSRFGTSIVKKAWKVAGPRRKRNGGRYSFQALNKVLRKKGGLTKVYAQFAADNLVPASTYPEGAEYRAPSPRRTQVLSRSRRGKAFKARLPHMASTSFRFVPDASLSHRKWKLRLKVSGPPRRTAPAAAVLVHLTNGRVTRKVVKLDRRGNGSIRVAFTSARIAGVSISLVNASTRMRCHRRTNLACAGKPLDNNLRFRVKARVAKR